MRTPFKISFAVLAGLFVALNLFIVARVFADNFGFTPGSGSTLASDTVSGIEYQRVKCVMGADGAYDMDVDSGQQVKASSWPVTIASDQGTELTWETASAYGHASITSSYTTAHTSSNAKKFLKLNNKTDGDLWVSFDASNNHIYLDIGEALIIDLSTNNRYESSNVSVKFVTDPTVGSLYVQAGY